ncbi:hypothetical protein M9H77_18657 [Catharanthus roseus]|uniref:Uncharacterized protein n=1 Tax=Catharanthus roseus TaxID=4058 RepID=A0ACC0B812_CATRO|nr:hypothetical protein M9H77_18657 [Catharanthus roseus]
MNMIMCFVALLLFHIVQKSCVGMRLNIKWLRPFLFICSDSLVLCRALGGKVAKANRGWDIGVRQVKILKENFHFIVSPHQLDEIPPALSIIECHQDEVREVPAEHKFGDHILGIQGHPEYNQDILINLIDRLLSNNSIELQLLTSEPDRKYWEKIAKAF